MRWFMVAIPFLLRLLTLKVIILPIFILRPSTFRSYLLQSLQSQLLTITFYSTGRNLSLPSKLTTISLTKEETQRLAAESMALSRRSSRWSLALIHTLLVQSILREILDSK